MSGDQHDDDPDDGEPKTQRDATERSSKNVPDPSHADDRSDEAAEEGDGEGGDGGDDRGARRKRRPLALVVALLVLAPLVLGAQVVGTDDAYTDGFTENVAPQVSGRVVSLDVADNQFVRRGQALIHVDPRTYIDDRDQAQAQLLAEDAGGAADFLRVLAELRRLQLADVLEIRLVDEGVDRNGKPNGARRLVIGFRDTSSASLLKDLQDFRRRTGLQQLSREVEVVYGTRATRPGELPVVTRSILGILSTVAFDVDVPEADVASGATVPSTIRRMEGLKPTIWIHSGPDRPDDAFASVEFRGTWFWIDDRDFDSKLAFGVVQLLIVLAQTPQTAGAIVTVPAR